jgi:hypothetical protein
MTHRRAIRIRAIPEVHPMTSGTALLWVVLWITAGIASAQSTDVFNRGTAIGLERAIPANERGILCLTTDNAGRVYGGTTGRTAHLFVYDLASDEIRSLARLEGGVGFAHGLVRLADGSLIGGTQADPTGIAMQTDPRAVGHLYRFTLADRGPATVEDLALPVPGQGILTLAYSEPFQEIVGNTWPDGHFFTYNLKTKVSHDHGAIAGYRTFETPRHAEDINRGTAQKVNYPRQVSRAIAIVHESGAFTAGANGLLYRYDFDTHKLVKLDLRLPAVPGREPWASLDAALVYRRSHGGDGEYSCLLGGTSDGYLFELRLFGRTKHELRPRGKPLRQGTIQGLVSMGPRIINKDHRGAVGQSVLGVAGDPDGMPHSFVFSHGASTSAVVPGGIPHVSGLPSMAGFGAIVADGRGNLYAGERDRIGRLIRYRFGAEEKPNEPKKPEGNSGSSRPTLGESPEPPAKLSCHIVFAPQGTTTDGSGYTAIEVGKDGQVYVGAARYGDYAWLLRFDPTRKPLFMDKVVNLRQLTGEHLQGINTQGKIHAKILVGHDGRIWFASKQAHEIFDTRPEYGEEANGYPGGHLCYFDPKTGFSRSMGILKKQEGLMGGAINDGQGKLYYRSEPKNHFLAYDLQTGEVQDRGHLGAACRYMVLDKKGAVYTIGRGATLCRYEPETGYVEDLQVKVEGEGPYEPPYVIALGPNGKLYGAGVRHPWVMEFDIETHKGGLFPEVVVRNVTPAAPPGMPVQDIHAAVFGQDGKLYYPMNTTGPLEKDGKPQAHLRIMRFDPQTRRTETLGLPIPADFDEEKVKQVYTRPAKYTLQYIQGAAVAADGSLYLMAIYQQLNVACFPQLTAPKDRQKP